MKIMVCHSDCFLEAFGFIVNTSGSYWIYITPVFFGLGMHKRVAVYFRSRGHKNPGALCFGKSHTVMGSQRTDLKSLYRYFEVINRTGRGSKMQYIIQIT